LNSSASLLGAIVLICLGSVFAALDAAISTVSMARVHELVRDERPGAVRLAKVMADRPRYINLVVLLRIVCEISATVLLAQFFYRAVSREWGLFIAAVVMVVISFVVIAGAWSRHHDMFRYVVDIDTRLRQLNMAWLLTVVLIPFATRLLTSRGHQTLGVHALRLGFYALLQVVASALLLLMLRHLTGHEQAPETPDPEVTSLTRQSYGWLLGFGLSIPLFFAWSYAWVLWIVGPLAFSIWSRWRQAPAGEDKDDAG